MPRSKSFIPKRLSLWLAVALALTACAASAGGIKRHADKPNKPKAIEFPFGNNAVANIPNVGRLTFACTSTHSVLTTLHGSGLKVTVRSASGRQVHIRQTQATFTGPSQKPGRQIWDLAYDGENATATAHVEIIYALSATSRLCYVRSVKTTMLVRPHS